MSPFFICLRLFVAAAKSFRYFGSCKFDQTAPDTKKRRVYRKRCTLHYTDISHKTNSFNPIQAWGRPCKYGTVSNPKNFPESSYRAANRQNIPRKFPWEVKVHLKWTLELCWFVFLLLKGERTNQNHAEFEVQV